MERTDQAHPHGTPEVAMTTADIVEALGQVRELACVACITSGDERFQAIVAQLTYLLERLGVPVQDQHDRARRHYEGLAKAARHA